MTNINTCNTGKVIGRVSKKTVLPNKDGSKKIFIQIASQDNYKNKDGKRGTQFVPLEAFVNKDAKTNGVFDHMNVGDLVSVAYEVRNNNYEDKNGEMQYGIVLVIKSVDLLESKKTTEARQAAKAEAAA